MEQQGIVVKISGGGTRKDVSKSLKLIAKSILKTPIEDLDGCEWEDCTLMTEVELEKIETDDN